MGAAGPISSLFGLGQGATMALDTSSRATGHTGDTFFGDFAAFGSNSADQGGGGLVLIAAAAVAGFMLGRLL